jgi:hypothetical protein
VRSYISAHYDKLLLLAAVLGLCASFGWLRQHQALLHSRPAEVSVPTIKWAGFHPMPEEIEVMKRPIWSVAAAQSRGVEWRFGLFTPPAIRIDASGEVSVALPIEASTSAPLPHVATFELLALKHEPYRLQLTGYCASPSGYLAMFSSPHSPGTWLMRDGDRLDDLGLTLLNFSVGRAAVVHDEADTIYESTAVAVLRDEWEGGEVVLGDRKIRLSSALYAVVRSFGAMAWTRDLRQGDAFTEGDFIYRVERIQKEPAEVMFSRRKPGVDDLEFQVFRLSKPAPEKVSSSGLLSEPSTKHAAIRDR